MQWIESSRSIGDGLCFAVGRNNNNNNSTFQPVRTQNYRVLEIGRELKARDEHMVKIPVFIFSA